MNEPRKVLVIGAVVTFAVIAGIAATRAREARDTTTRNSEASVVTNDNGSVSRTFVESTVTTNGSMVTERRRETRTTLDNEGNMLATSTSEYAQSYTVGEVAASRPALGERVAPEAEDGSLEADSFLGLKFGDEFEGGEFSADPAEPTLLRSSFKPAKALAGFDDYFVYVTPETHRIAKICACAREAVEPGASWRRHYLIEALEKRYHTWARLCSFTRPCYAFDLGGGRSVTACLAEASRDYETVLVAWDMAVLTAAADETEARRRAALKAAAETRARRVEDAALAF